MRIARLSDAVRVGVGAFAGVGMLLGASGCLATRSWVSDQLRPITGQQQQLEAQMNNLHLERKLVLDSTNGPTFKTGSAALSTNAKREIDQFVGDMEGSGSTPAASAQTERARLLHALGRHNWNLAAAAASLVLSRERFILRLCKAGFDYLLKPDVIAEVHKKVHG